MRDDNILPAKNHVTLLQFHYSTLADSSLLKPVPVTYRHHVSMRLLHFFFFFFFFFFFSISFYRIRTILLFTVYPHVILLSGCFLLSWYLLWLITDLLDLFWVRHFISMINYQMRNYTLVTNSLLRICKDCCWVNKH